MENYKKLYRSKDNKMISGVCGGIAEYFAVDPTLIRLLWVAVSIFGFGTGLIVYIICAIIVPEGQASTYYSSEYENEVYYSSKNEENKKKDR